jgi:hypothetical protein
MKAQCRYSSWRRHYNRKVDNRSMRARIVCSRDSQRVWSKGVIPWQEVSIVVTTHHERRFKFSVTVSTGCKIEPDRFRIFRLGFDSKRISRNRNIYDVSVGELKIEIGIVSGASAVKKNTQIIAIYHLRHARQRQSRH